MNKNEKPRYYGRDLEAMSFANNYHKWIIDEFRPYLQGVAAEIGAGGGNFTNFLIDAGIDRIVAFEPSINMFPLLAESFAQATNVEVVNSFLEEKVDQYKTAFDCICYVNVLEHIEDDKKELSCAYYALKQGGRILIFVPALSFLYSELDRKVGHYRRYHKSELIDLIQGNGFQIEKIKYFDIVGIIPWYIAFVLFGATTTKSNVSLYDRLVVPIMRPIELAINPFIGKNLLLVAKKI